MRQGPLRHYIWFGAIVESLVRGAFPKVEHALIQLNSFEEQVTDLGLSVTAALASSLGLDDLRSELAERDSDEMLAAEELARLMSIADRVQDTLYAETQAVDAYFVSAGLYDIRRLLDAPSELFEEGVFERLSDIAQHDFAEAGRTLAFEIPTAAAFFLMRGTEAVLQTFYLARVRRGRLRPLMWGPMVAHLRRRSDAPPSRILDNLDHIRRNYRNPTQHPEATYTVQQAESLFPMCVAAVNDMIRDLPSREDSEDSES